MHDAPRAEPHADAGAELGEGGRGLVDVDLEVCGRGEGEVEVCGRGEGEGEVEEGGEGEPADVAAAAMRWGKCTLVSVSCQVSGRCQCRAGGRVWG